MSLRFAGLLSDPGEQVASNDPSSAQHDTIAIYYDATRTIYLPEGWTGGTLAELSVLVHEVVHHFQNVLRLKYECPQEREKLAYIAQDRWLGLFGHSLSDDFALDPFSLFVPHREVVWVIFGQISSGCLLLLLPLWACGQRTCVVHHVHSDVGRAAYSIRGSVTSPCPALGPTGASRTRMQRPRTATRPEACR